MRGEIRLSWLTLPPELTPCLLLTRYRNKSTKQLDVVVVAGNDGAPRAHPLQESVLGFSKSYKHNELMQPLSAGEIYFSLIRMGPECLLV